MTNNRKMQLGRLVMGEIDEAELRHFARTMQEKTFPQLREDMKRAAKNVAIARKFVAY